MVHYKVDFQTTGDLVTNFPHSPQDIPASIQDYLEDKWASGWELSSAAGDSTTIRFYFKANAQ